MQKSGNLIAVAPIQLCVTVARRYPSQCRSERLLNVLRKGVDHGTLVVMIVRREEPAVNERVDLGAVKFDHKAAKARQTSRPASPHSLC